MLYLFITAVALGGHFAGGSIPSSVATSLSVINHCIHSVFRVYHMTGITANSDLIGHKANQKKIR